MGNVWILPLWLVVSTASADLKTALKKYQNVESLTVGFEQMKILKDMDFRLKSEGQMSVTPPNHIIWEVRKPAPLKFELDTEDANSAIPEKQRREIAQMILWLRLDPDALSKDYEVVENSPNSFSFTAKNKDGVFKSMQLTLKNGFAETVTLDENSGDRIALKFARPNVKYKK